MENEIVVRDEAKEAKSNAEILLIETKDLKITNQTTLDLSVIKLNHIKGSWKFLDAQRKEATKPMDTAKKVIMSWFKPILKELKDRETELKSAGVKYLESRKTDVKMEGADLTERWHAEVTDKSIIPIDWLEPKMKQLNELATATKGESPIPGIKFVKVKGMSASSK